MGNEELIILLTAYITDQQYEKAIGSIKMGILRLHGHDLLRLDLKSDSEYNSPSFNVPLELRVKLGICRLFLNRNLEPNVQIFNLGIIRFPFVF